MHVYDHTHTLTHESIQTHRYTPLAPRELHCAVNILEKTRLKRRLKEMEDLYRLFPGGDTQVGDGGERKTKMKEEGEKISLAAGGGWCAQSKWDTEKQERQAGMGGEHQMLSSSWSGRIPVWIQAPWLMRIINMACPASLNAGEDWKMGDKNKTSQAYPRKIHKAGACKGWKKDIAHAGCRRNFLIQRHMPRLETGDAYPTRALTWTPNSMNSLWSKRNQFRCLRFHGLK